MAAEYLPTDLGGLYALAELYQRRWTYTEVRELIHLAAEIRLQEVRFGLSPVDRARLQWEVGRAEEAEEKTTRRRRKQPPPDTPTDPRTVLKVLS